ncbi:BRISC and BRCA1-A complex member 2-like [Anthonomus grandis grandis]|uniref:BRISC and BRCA1-A complex member 2-like n=1 Tax=Anthonomus grandis grandis TaxID=2921223 RepID=UPI002166BDCD|nr:BRISC and BRCA1-A complex member 2-like [Anthonomus grandis grandis]
MSEPSEETISPTSQPECSTDVDSSSSTVTLFSYSDIALDSDPLDGTLNVSGEGDREESEKEEHDQNNEDSQEHYEGHKEEYDGNEEEDEYDDEKLDDDDDEEYDDNDEKQDMESIELSEVDLLQSNLETLADYGKFDLQARPNRYLELVEGFKNYHFYLNVPYAGKFLKWELIFDPEDLMALPDFDFNDCSFLSEPDINYIAENIPSWDNWDLNDTDSILNIIKEFLALYGKTQLDKLLKENKYCKFKEQYEELLNKMDLTPDKVEVQIETKNESDYGGTTDDFIAINFLVNLPIDFSKLLEYSQPGLVITNPGEDYAHLHIQFRKLDHPQTKVALNLSARPEQALERLRVAKLGKDATLYEYVKTFKSIIDNQIQLLWDRSEARGEFIAAIVAHFAKSIVEYDCTRNTKISFIYDETEDYTALVTVKLSHDYPRDKPKILLQSIFCQVGKFCQAPVIFHNYDAEGTVEQNIMNFREVLKVEVPNFQNHKH